MKYDRNGARYGWGTQDPTDLGKMSEAERAEYKKKSVEGGLPEG